MRLATDMRAILNYSGTTSETEYRSFDIGWIPEERPHYSNGIEVFRWPCGFNRHGRASPWRRELPDPWLNGSGGTAALGGIRHSSGQ
jgi:hypothetical protein